MWTIVPPSLGITNFERADARRKLSEPPRSHQLSTRRYVAADLMTDVAINTYATGGRFSTQSGILPANRAS
jgi:hypothetical protein